MPKHPEHSMLEILLSQGLITKKQAEGIHSRQDALKAKLIKTRSNGHRRGGATPVEITLIDIMVSMKLKHPSADAEFIGEADILRAIAAHLGLEFITIDPLKLDSNIVTRIISRPYAVKNILVPIALSASTLTIATANPLGTEVFEQIRQSKGYELAIVVATKTDIIKVITEFHGFKSSVAAAELQFSAAGDLGNLEQYIKLKSITELDATDHHIINAVEYLLHYAYGQRASDIHIEPKREHSLIRLRIDGLLHTVHKMPRAVHPAFVTRIKALARMDIAEKRRPQDGRIKTSFEGKEIELRVATLAVAFGEKVVIRIFDPNVLMQDLGELGFQDTELELFKSFIAAPNGLILVTGPTGSGKTTTLYSALRAISSPGVNITTIEDPIEMVYEEFNQTAVHTQIGLTFAASLRTILRQDPDIIMVGEIRDFETADNAIQSALTGHLVLSTLHTNDAPSSVARLLDLGVAPFLINSSIVGIVAQRLLRKVCPHCAESYELGQEECRLLGLHPASAQQKPVSIGRGCAQCRGTGYLGRDAVFEIMEMNEAIREAVDMKAAPSVIRKLAQQSGYRPLREAAIAKLLEGETTFEEIIRVLGVTVGV